MAASKKSEKQLVVSFDRLELAELDFTIVGISPLITHCFSSKAMKMINQPVVSKKTRKVPFIDYIESMYWLTEKPDIEQDNVEDVINDYNIKIQNGAKFGFPLTGIKDSIISGAYRSGLTKNKVDMASSFFLFGITNDSTPDLAEIISDSPVMRQDTVRIGGSGKQKTADLRYRAQFNNWSMHLKLQYNVNGKFTPDDILQCVDYGGFGVGIGEWRPEHKGQFGMYQILR